MKLAVGILSILAACNACSGVSLTPQQVQGINEGVCALEHYATDANCRKVDTLPTCVGDTASACGITEASVQSIFASHKKAMIADGVVLPPQVVSITDGGKE